MRTLSPAATPEAGTVIESEVVPRRNCEAVPRSWTLVIASAVSAKKSAEIARQGRRAQRNLPLCPFRSAEPSAWLAARSDRSASSEEADSRQCRAGLDRCQ